MTGLRLHGYYRSTAAWRVRIALNLKGIAADHRAVHLRHGAQRAADHLRLNPQGLVPTLEVADQGVLTQSLAICEWLEETFPLPPLLPESAWARARIRQFAMIIACDTHPVQNLRVLSRLRAHGFDADAVAGWAVWAMQEGLGACEALATELSDGAAFCSGDAPGLAEICLVPQLYNARRFGCDLAPFPTLRRIEARCQAIEAFKQAEPARQADYEAA